MRKERLTKFFIMGAVLWSIAIWTNSGAQEAEYNLAHRDIFGSLRRPPVSFSHEIHAAAFEAEGCGVCHHVQDDQSGKLVYLEGEELSCLECHRRQNDNHKPGLREAFHGSCTACHRRRIENDKPRSGPTTCGGCHVRH